MTCLQDCLVEPKRDSRRQPSLVLLWAESFSDAADTWGLLGFTSPQRSGGIGLSKGDFFFYLFPPAQKVPCTVLETSCSWKGAGRSCSRVVHHLCLLKVLCEMTLSDGGNEPANTSCKMETSFLWLCLVGCWEKGGGWDWGISSRHPARRRGRCCGCQVELRLLPPFCSSPEDRFKHSLPTSACVFSRKCPDFFLSFLFSLEKSWLHIIMLLGQRQRDCRSNMRQVTHLPGLWGDPSSG